MADGVTAAALKAEIDRRARRAQAALAAPAPPVAFAFRVAFGEDSLKEETAFREVSGIEAEMQTEEVTEGGETRFVHRLPKGVKYKPLVLRRGVGAGGSALVRWCRVTMESSLAYQIRTVPVTVYLLDADSSPLRAWLFADAYPVKWETGAFDAMKNELAIETITLSYTYSTRIL